MNSKQKMKKIIAMTIAAIFVVGSLAACGSGKEGSVQTGGSSAADNGEKLQIVTTIFPIYDWVENILGENAPHADVRMLLDNGVDLHSYQPTVEDIMNISTCDLFVYVGGESDAWVSDALKEAVNPDMVVVNLLELLGDSVKEEELKEGMQGEEHEDEEEAEYDEHVWLSLRNAELLCEKIEQEMEEIDPDCKDIYQKNLEAYAGKLQALDAEYNAVVSKAPVRTLLFGDRFPFRYLVDDYGLDYYAAFVGCSAETEASFETITFLAGKVDELSLHSVVTIEGSDQRLAETVVQTSKAKDAQILSLNSMQSVTAKDVQSGTSYLSMMEENLKVLEEALK
ncbi:MAG: metal ABC transporter substrate-binding protein [Lachnospiraceae bacterium]|nr:metal ABC transporter substrate-binding protein [Lachnospiraceae bacterium]